MIESRFAQLHFLKLYPIVAKNREVMKNTCHGTAKRRRKAQDRYRSRKAGEIVQPARKSRRAVDNQAVCGLKRPPLATVSIGHTPVRFKSPVTVVDHDFRAIFPLEIHPAAMAKIEAVSLTGPDKAERLTRRGSIA